MKILLGLAAAFASSLCCIADVAPAPRIKQESRDKIVSLSNVDGSAAQILVPERREGTPIPLSSIPKTEINKAANWIRKIIRPKWLPSDLENKLTALKGTIIRHSQVQSNGVGTGDWTSDFFLLENESDGCSIHILESGVGLSMRVDLPAEVDIASDPEIQIRNLLVQFFNIPDTADIFGLLEIKADAPLFRATRRGGMPPVPKVPGEMDTRTWWHGVRVWTDGHFFFADFPEIEPGPYYFRSKTGPQSRF